jgi:hypothetical protein
VDATGNVYISDLNHSAVKELPYAFVDPTTKSEPAAAGSDALPVVLPSTADLGGPFAPSSDQSWLTITGVTGGVVNFNFASNTGFPRTAHITVLGQTVTVTQASSIALVPVNLSASLLASGSFQISFSNTPGATFTVLATTNLALPLSAWTPLASPVESPPGKYQFATPSTNADIFYVVRAP